MPLPLTIRFLLIMAAAMMLACGPVAQSGPGDGNVLPPGQQLDGGDEPTEEPGPPTATPEPTAAPATATPYPEPPAGDSAESGTDSANGPYSNPPPPPLPTLKYPNLEEHNLDRLAVEADAAQADGSHSCTGPYSPGIFARIWMSTNPEDGKTRDLVKWLETQGVPPDFISVSEGGYYEDGSSIWVGALPTRLLGPLAQREGVTLVRDAAGEIGRAPDVPGQPGPKYPALEKFSRYAEEVEEAQANAAPGQAAVKGRKVFVLISLSSGDSGEPMLAWLRSNGVSETDDWRYGVENHLVAVYGTCFYAGSGPAPGYIYAIAPASLLLPLMEQPGFYRVEDACNGGFQCHPLYSRKYPVSR